MYLIIVFLLDYCKERPKAPINFKMFPLKLVRPSKLRMLKSSLLHSITVEGKNFWNNCFTLKWGTLSSFLEIQVLLVVGITSNKYQGNESWKLYKSNKVYDTFFWFHDIQQLILDKFLSKCSFYSSYYCYCSAVLNRLQFLIKGNFICLIVNDISIIYRYIDSYWRRCWWHFLKFA